MWNKDYYRRKHVYLSYRYKDQRARVNGKKDGGGKNCPWLGLPIGSREEFIEWALNDPEFNRLYQEWVDNGFSHRGPTAHRIDRRNAREGGAGYVVSNIVWRSHLEKSRESVKKMQALKKK